MITSNSLDDGLKISLMILDLIGYTPNTPNHLRFEVLGVHSGVP